MRFMPHSKLRGFTLLELLIVISIVLILTVAAFAVYNGVLRTRKKTLAVLQVSQIVEAATQYFQDLNVYPPDTGVYEGADQPPQGMNGSQIQYSISRYLGRELIDVSTGKRYGPYIRDMSEKNLKGDPADCDGMRVQLYCDPWGNPYEMDCMHSIRDAKSRTVVKIMPYDDSIDPKEQTLEVKVWSKGPDGKASEKASFYPVDKTPDDEDNVMSWTKGTKP